MLSRTLETRGDEVRASHADKQHPLVREAIARFRRGLQEPYDLDTGHIEYLRRRLAEHFGSPELVDAVESLARLAQVMATRRASPTLALKLMQVANSATDALRRLSEPEVHSQSEAGAAVWEPNPTRRPAPPTAEAALASGGIPLDK